MPKAAKIDSSIELTCCLCPKTPKFSDISHLLTHVSSKSHLAHRFRLQIRANTEPEAKEKLDNFDNWYQENNLDTMLSLRLSAKTQKKTAKERKARISNAYIVSSDLVSFLRFNYQRLCVTDTRAPVGHGCCQNGTKAYRRNCRYHTSLSCACSSYAPMAHRQYR